MSSEAWFSVEPGDIFPEQFPTFLFPPGPQRDTFLELHGDLAEPTFWRTQQERLREGIHEDLFTYPDALRFKNRFGGYGSGPPNTVRSG
jgi:isocitrate dehydrogenase kinase/phosphatase